MNTKIDPVLLISKKYFKTQAKTSKLEQLNSELDQKNSKLKQKTQGFGKFIWLSCRIQVQIRSLIYIQGIMYLCTYPATVVLGLACL